MHLDITFGLQVVERASLVSVRLTIPTSPYFHLLVNGFCVVSSNLQCFHYNIKMLM